jgi:excinuclease ABC subunit A
LLLLVRLLENRKGEHRELLEECRQDGLVRLRIDGEVVRSEDVTALDKRRKHNVDAVLDRVVIGTTDRQRLNDSVESALRRGKGVLLVHDEQAGEDRIYSQNLACDACGISFPELSPQSFSFNSPQGMCTACNGLGTRVEIDPRLVIPNESLSVDGGAIAPWGEDVSEKTTWDFRSQILEKLKIDTTKPWNKLPAKQRQQLLWGTGETKYQVEWKAKSGKGQFQISWEGIVPRLMRRFTQTSSERSRQWYSQFMADAACSACEGSRMRAESAAVRVQGKSIVEISSMTVADAHALFAAMALPGNDGEIAKEIIKELVSRLGFLVAVGLDYLSLDRAGPTLSGGEAQRIRLASQVGSERKDRLV